ncbi:MAG TPA: DUF4003 family protein [Anoxybacillus sp.]|jgi:hypothetical protein|nr:DUF4003 family protein [Anoxybacillus sp.]
MLTARLQQKIKRYKAIYAQLKDELKWKVLDQRILMTVASMYVVNDQEFHLQRFLRISHYMKEQVGMFSLLKSYQRFPTAAVLDIRFEKPEEKFREFLNLYEKFIQFGFARGTFTYLAALALMSTSEDHNDYEEKLERSLAVYKGMKAKHFFLTTSADYPLAVLLANTEEDVNKLLDRIESFYEKLSAKGVRKGNDLQFLSHILALNKETEADVLVGRCVRLFDLFKRSGTKLKAMHYPMIGLLAFVDECEKEMATIQQLINELHSEKFFKWHKDINIMMAVNFWMSDKIENARLLETEIYTAIEILIQAQQAAFIAALAATSATSSSGGGE